MVLKHCNPSHKVEIIFAKYNVAVSALPGEVNISCFIRQKGGCLKLDYNEAQNSPGVFRVK